MGIMIGARFPETIVKKIDCLVDSQEYLNRADVLRVLVRKGLETADTEAVQ